MWKIFFHKKASLMFLRKSLFVGGCFEWVPRAKIWNQLWLPCQSLSCKIPFFVYVLFVQVYFTRQVSLPNKLKISMTSLFNCFSVFCYVICTSVCFSLKYLVTYFAFPIKKMSKLKKKSIQTTHLQRFTGCLVVFWWLFTVRRNAHLLNWFDFGSWLIYLVQHARLFFMYFA